MPLDRTGDATRNEILRGWKEIAEHLHASVRTAQRWEATAGLPVQRKDTTAGVVVFADRPDLDRWLHSDKGQVATLEQREGADAETALRSRWSARWHRLVAVSVMLMLGLAAASRLPSSLATTHPPSPSTSGAIQAAMGAGQPESAQPSFVYVTLHFDSDSVGTVGIPRGGTATIGLKNQDRYALSVDFDSFGAVLQFAKVSELPTTTVADQQAATRVALQPHVVTPVRDVPGLASVELYPPGQVPPRRQ